MIARAAILLGAALAAAVPIWGLLSARGGAPPAALSPTVGSNPEQPGVAVPLAPVEAPAGVQAAVSPRTTVRVAGRAVEDRALDAVRELGELVEASHFTPDTFTREARALAARLGPEAGGALAALLANETEDLAVRVAAAELLRARAEAGGTPPLGPAALSALRGAALDAAEGPAMRAAAGPSLAALGGPLDRERLLAMLATKGDEAARADAARALRAASDSRSADGLAELVVQGDERGAVLAAVALSARLSTGSMGGARDRAIDALAVALSSSSSPALRLRAAGALGEVPGATSELAVALRAEAHEPDLARAIAGALGRTRQGRDVLRDALDETLEGAPDSAALSAAEELLRADPAGADGSAAREVLLSVASAPGPSLARLRAIGALLAAGGPDVEAHLAHLSAADSDPLVRALVARGPR